MFSIKSGTCSLPLTGGWTYQLSQCSAVARDAYQRCSIKACSGHEAAQPKDQQAVMGSRQQAAQAIARAARSGQESAATPKGWVQQVAGWHPKYAAAATAGVCAAVIAAQLDKDAAKQALKDRLGRAVEAIRVYYNSFGRRQLEPVPAPPLQPGTFSGYAARWLADWCAQPDRCEVAVALGGAPLIDWLVDTACSASIAASSPLATAHELDDGSASAAGSLASVSGNGGEPVQMYDIVEQQQAERALTYLLHSENTAGLVAARPGAIPRLIRLATSGAATPALLEALSQRARLGLVQHASTSSTQANNSSREGLVSSVLGLRQPTVSSTPSAQGPEALLSDLQELLFMFKSGGRSLSAAQEAESVSNTSGSIPSEHPSHQWDAAIAQEQQLAAAWLATWAEANPVNCSKLLGLDLVSAISHIVQSSGAGGHTPEALALHRAMVRIMGALATPGRPSSADGALSHIPSTSGNPSTQLPNSAQSYVPAKHHLASCVQPLVYIAADAAVEGADDLAAQAMSALSKALREGGSPVQDAVLTSNLLPLMRKLSTGCGSTLRLELSRTLAALVATGALDPATHSWQSAHLSYWREWLLSALTQETPSALASIADSDIHEAEAGTLDSVGTSTSTDRSHMQQQQPEGYGAVQQNSRLPVEAVRQETCRALAALAALPGATGMQVSHYWLAALLESLAARVWPYNAVVYAGPQVNTGIRSISDAALASAEQHLKQQQQGVSSLPSGSSPQVSAGELAAAGGSPSVPATSLSPRDVSALVDAVPLLPSHIKSIATALASASAAAGREEAEDSPPSEFDLFVGAAPRRRPTQASRNQKDKIQQKGKEEGSQDASLQDSLAVEQRVVQALEALNAVVAADPAKQRWLLSVGALPMLHALLLNMHGDKRLLRASARAGHYSSSVDRDALPLAPDVYTDHDGTTHLALARQAARLLALLAVHPEGRHQVGSPKWRPWLEVAATSDDCRLASHAAKALLNLEALRDSTCPIDAKAPGRGTVFTASSTADAGRTASTVAPVYLDSVHLLTPTSPLLWRLAREGQRPNEASLFAGAYSSASLPLVPTEQASTHMMSRSSSDRQLLHNSSMEQEGVAVAGGMGATLEGTTDAGTAATSAGVARVSQSTSQEQLLKVTFATAAAESTSNAEIDSIPEESQPASTSSSTTQVSGLLLVLQPLSTAAVGAATAVLQPLSNLTSALTHLVTGIWTPAAPALGGSSGSQYSLGLGALLQPAAVQHPAGDLHSGPGPALEAPRQADATISTTERVVSTAVAETQSVAASAAEQQATQSQMLQRRATPQGQYAEQGAHEPEVDVVFVHGVRGGPFITWRKPGVQTKGRGRVQHLSLCHCWPSDWLASDFPTARLLTLEYLAPVTGWEGESLPLEDTVVRLMDALAAAGVGQRPVVFVAHSMGGLLVKEMLARSLQDGHSVSSAPGAVHHQGHASLASQAKGVVFFATPHFGSMMAAYGWKLRHVPYAAPAPCLARLTPGPHLVELNAVLAQLHAGGRGLRVASAIEGQPTQLSAVLPKILIVPEESAYPGFGARLDMRGHDHISLCKPEGRDAPAYQVVANMLRDVLTETRASAKASAAENTSP